MPSLRAAILRRARLMPRDVVFARAADAPMPPMPRAARRRAAMFAFADDFAALTRRAIFAPLFAADFSAPPRCRR